MGIEKSRCRLMKVSTYSTVSTIVYDKDDLVCPVVHVLVLL